MNSTAPLVAIRNLSVDFNTRHGLVRAVDNIELTVYSGQMLGIVGESGSGKSVTMLALMGLTSHNAIINAEQMHFNGQDLLTMPNKLRRQLRGGQMSMIFQEPRTSLNPAYSIGFQLVETINCHQGGSRKQNKQHAIDLLARVGIPAPNKRFSSFPHELSGGMCQRVMIAMAIACQPKLLIADEPTTALDTSIQAQIFDLLLSLQQEIKMSLIIISHDMGAIAQMAQQVMVMYAGQVVEQRPVTELFKTPRHPYSYALMQSLPELAPPGAPLPTIPGTVPSHLEQHLGCLFAPRCPYARANCQQRLPELTADHSGAVRCYYPISTNNEHHNHD